MKLFVLLLAGAALADVVDDDFGADADATDFKHPWGVEPLYEQLKEITERLCDGEGVNTNKCYGQLAKMIISEAKSSKSAVSINKVPKKWRSKLDRTLRALKLTEKRKRWADSDNHTKYMLSIGFHRALATMSQNIQQEKYSEAGKVAQQILAFYGLDMSANMFLSNAFVGGIRLEDELTAQSLMLMTQGWFHYVILQGTIQSIQRTGTGKTLDSPVTVVARLEVPRFIELTGYEEYCAWDMEDGLDQPVPDKEKGCGSLEHWRQEYIDNPEKYQEEEMAPIVSQFVPSYYHSICDKDETSCKTVLQMLIRNKVSTRFIFFNVDQFFNKGVLIAENDIDFYEGDDIMDEQIGIENKKKQKKKKKKKKGKKETSWRQLLKRWKLSKFANNFAEEAWTEPKSWHMMTIEDLRDMGLGKGHIAKFKKKLLDYDLVPKEEL